jgi:hypothetical protein
LTHFLTRKENRRNNYNIFIASNIRKTGSSLFVDRISKNLKPYENLTISQQIWGKNKLKEYLIENC